jgi:hypothetical protein
MPQKKVTSSDKCDLEVRLTHVTIHSHISGPHKNYFNPLLGHTPTVLTKSTRPFLLKVPLLPNTAMLGPLEDKPHPNHCSHSHSQTGMRSVKILFTVTHLTLFVYSGKQNVDRKCKLGQVLFIFSKNNKEFFEMKLF